MQHLLLFLVSLLASTLTALPLNINLGAYSPALVVGDGEISFGGKQDVSNLINALEGAAVSGAAANGAAAPAVSASAFPAPAAASQNQVPDQGTQIAALQGMGKEIAPRIQTGEVKKRDINGFNAALKFATDALKTSPKVQLGTGAEGSGVGILQDAGISAPAAAATPKPAAAAAREAPTKKDEAGLERKMGTTVTTMFVRGAPARAQAVSNARNLEGSPVEKRAPSQGIDGVNLNVAEGQVAELTFVETRAVGDDDDE